MKNDLRNVYVKGMSPEQLANAVLDQVSTRKISLPIDPFRIMRMCGIVYQFMDFKKLEGIYIVPEDENDTPIVGININRPITRQRFTAAHELCHHIKDRKSEMCAIDDLRDVEKYAERFAAALLMPDRLFESEIKHALQKSPNNKMGLYDALHLSIKYGVSFSSCANKLFYKYHILDIGNNDTLSNAISAFRPNKKKEKLELKTEDVRLLEQSINSYTIFFGPMNEQLTWLSFKNDFIFNENRMEGINLSKEKVSEIVTDLRLHGNESIFCNESNAEIIQIVGHASIYDFLATTTELPTIMRLTSLHKMLYQYAPFPEFAGNYRTTNNHIKGAQIHTSDWWNIKEALQSIEPEMNAIIKNAARLSVSEYIRKSAKIHHRITQIHPFQDGNGRTSRCLLNWMFKVKRLPPIYIQAKDKDDYYQALTNADKSNDCKELERIFIHELFRTSVRINRNLIDI